MRKIIFASMMALVLVFGGCRSAQKRQAEQEIVSIDREKTLATQLSKNLDAALGAWSDSSVEHILNDLLARLRSADKSYEAEVKAPRVHLLATTTPYIAAGLDDVVYISRGLLGAVFYENELAFELATQLALLREHAAARNLANLQGQEVGTTLITLPTAPPVVQKDFIEKGWFEPGGLFDYDNDAYLKAARAGVQLAYAAKYDPRGAVNLIQRWNTAPYDKELKPLGKILPDPEEHLKSARDEVAKLSPLRDPIVKSHAFEELKARLNIKKAKQKKRS